MIVYTYIWNNKIECFIKVIHPSPSYNTKYWSVCSNLRIKNISKKKLDNARFKCNNPFIREKRL